MLSHTSKDVSLDELQINSCHTGIYTRGLSKNPVSLKIGYLLMAVSG